MSHKGANFIIKEAGDEGKVAVDGHQCTVRASEEKIKAADRCEKSPPPSACMHGAAVSEARLRWQCSCSPVVRP